MEFINNDYKNSEITSRIIGAAFKVHNHHGNGFPEIIYQRSLEIEMSFRSIVFEKEKSIKIYYRNIEVGERCVDFLIEETVSVELKAVSCLEPAHLSQALNYLKAFKLDTGLLINFGAKKLEWKRLIHTLR